MSGCSRSPASPRTGPASRSAPATAWSSGSTPRCSTRTAGSWSGSPTATRSSAPSSCAPATRSCASSPATPSCCTSPPAAVRPQGRSGGGIAGIRLTTGERVVFFGAFTPGEDAVVVTASGSSTALPGTEPGAVKVTPFSEYPAKGRATGGVRCHRFLKGEDTLVLAWAGPGPARAAASSGAAVDLPEANGRRDGSGVPGHPADPGGVRPGRRPPRLLSRHERLRRMLTPAPSYPRRPGRRRPGGARSLLASCSGADSAPERDARGAAGGGQGAARRDLRACTSGWPPTSSPRASTGCSPPRASARTTPRSRATIKVAAGGHHRRRRRGRGRRGGLREAAVHHEVRRRSTRPTTAPPTRPT